MRSEEKVEDFPAAANIPSVNYLKYPCRRFCVVAMAFDSGTATRHNCCAREMISRDTFEPHVLACASEHSAIPASRNYPRLSKSHFTSTIFDDILLLAHI